METELSLEILEIQTLLYPTGIIELVGWNMFLGALLPLGETLP